jgi:branched-chain amino acid transport system permease protein
MSGILSFGHPAFALVGAYAAAWLTIAPAQKAFLFPALPTWILHSQFGVVSGALIAGGLASLVALVASTPIMQLIGIAASLATFAFLVIMNVIASNWTAATRGTLSVFGIPQNTTMQIGLAFAAGSIVVAWAFANSAVGLRLKASREDEVAARAAGIAVVSERRMAFVLSAFLTGIGGFLFAQFLGSFNPDVFYTQMAFLTITMLVVGGIHSLSGAVLGTVVISALSAGLRRVEGGVSLGGLHIPGRVGLVEVGLALALLGFLVFRPEGLLQEGDGRQRRLSLLRLPRNSSRAETDDLDEQEEQTGVRAEPARTRPERTP